ncbi:hypothetical protein [Croceicoccus mobilis]|uniref:Lipoprotein n=1 Tax=Croceicoccus mobilis TaxID=1703339 RepID=A0A917DW25_9SPHN|nr:hypothetical protein [Croceicoccus mobilis]GGD76728.1 hypothetical protein GCM10010990_28030 [Croceicoccus mobilis]
MRNRPFAISLTIMLLAAPLGACATYPGDAPIVDGGTPAPDGSAVALGQPVSADTVVLTPMEVIEDSRCAAGTECVWQGRVVVTTRVDGAGWRETVNLIAGQDQSVRGVHVVLYEVAPTKGTGEISASDYRFKLDANDMKPVM